MRNIIGIHVFQLFLQVWYEGLDHPVIADLEIRQNGRGHPIGGVKYEQLYYSCPLTTGEVVPTHVSIVEEPCSPADNYMKVTRPYRGPYLHEFGICVPVAYGYIDPYRIVEWVELQKILGVTEINIYPGDLDKRSISVLQHYEQEGIVRLFYAPTVPYHDNTEDSNGIANPLSMNDCIYRNMYRYKWAVVIDVDEVIMPRQDHNLSAMIARISHANHLDDAFRSYTFRNTYFWVQCETSPKEPRGAYILRNRKREEPNGPMSVPKSIINPRRCLCVHNHHCYHQFNMPRGEKWTLDVPTNMGLSHHY